MSLQLAAQHLASKGRGPDTMLVHMAPGEVKSLQALARAHGGTLTTNPDTGLPEAGFLSALLPIIAGAALGPAGAGLFSSALTAGLGVGAATGLITGSLGRGLMAGLGAYGGAGLMGSVMGAGTGAISAGAPGAAGTLTGADFAGQAASLSNDAAAMLNPVTTAAPGAVPIDLALPQGTALPPQYLQGAVDPFGGYPAAAAATPVATVTPAVAAPTFPGTLTGADFAGQASSLSSDAAQQLAVANKLAAATPLQTFQAGIGAIADKPALLFNKANLGYGLAAAAPIVAAAMEPPKQEAYKDSGPNPYRYTYSANPTGARPGLKSAEPYYFRPAYTRMAEGGTTDSVDDVEGAAASKTDNPYAYTYNPKSQRYTRTIEKPVSVADPVITVPSETYGGGNSSSGQGAGGWSSLTPAEQAAYYAENPTMSAITQMGQQALGLTALGMMQNAVNPNFAAQQAAIAQGLDPNSTTNVNSINATNGLDVQSDQATAAAAAAAAAAANANAATTQGAAPGSDAPGSDTSNSDGLGGPGSPGGWARGGIAALARGGYSHLGDYSDGGRLLRGPGDGVSDSIPATIANKRPARLADGEFVVPARIVSELGNGSTEAGARKLYAMMDRVQKNRAKTVGKGRVAVNSRADKYLPA